jgi:hypothetical protein
LIHQTIHAHFHDDYFIWTQVGILPHDCRCDHGSFNEHPIRILEYAERHFPEYELGKKITSELLLAYDKVFVEYFEDLCQITPFIEVTPEKLMDAIRNDQDNARPVVQNYLNKKLKS